MENEYIRIASFDIGKKNFAFCVEKMEKHKFDHISKISPSQRYLKEGTPSPVFQPILKEVCNNGKIELLDNVDLTKGASSKVVADTVLFINMTHLLDQYKNKWNECDVFIIEQQMSFGKNKNNIAALKLAQHCMSYFLIHHESKTIINFPAYHKTKVLGAPKKLSKTERKKWSVEKAIEILMDREDHDAIRIIASKKKKDDMSDVITQLNAFKYLYFVDKSIT